MSKNLKQQLFEFATSQGFTLIGVCDMYTRKIDEERLQEWINRGYAGEMNYLNRPPQLRLDPRNLLPSARSLISLAIPYLPFHPDSNPPADGAAYGRISVYAWGLDYHNVIGKKLKNIHRFLHETMPKKNIEMRSFVDATPLAEKIIAERVGLGFIGKNTTLITKDFGSWVFLAEILLNQELETDVNIFADCIDCKRCLKACPTGALVEPYILNPRLCISYHTNFNRNNPIPDSIKEKMNSWLFGCDICQLCCPYNQYVVETDEPQFMPRDYIHKGWLKLELILSIQSEREFQTLLANSSLRQIGLYGLQRNAAIVAGNLRARELKPLLENLYRTTKDIKHLADAINYALARL